MFRIVALVIVLASADAHAEGPWMATISGGPAAQRVTGRSENDVLLGATARLDVGYRVSNSVALGPHLGIGFVRLSTLYPRNNQDPETSNYVPLEGGLGAQVLIADRALVSPWVGANELHGVRLVAVGLQLGYDVVVREHDRISAIASITVAPRENREGYQGLVLGMAYRCW
jgi:hypothetical protein